MESNPGGSERSLTIFAKGVLFAKKGLSCLSELIFPSRCLFCGKLLEDHSCSDQDSGADEKIPSGICKDCWYRILPVNLSCPKCGGTRHEIIPSERSCPSCKRWFPSFKRIVAFGEYRSKIEPFILAMKKDTTGRWAEQWVKLLLFLREKEIRALDSDLILPVPMFITRKIARGVNSPEEIARSLARKLHIPCSVSTLVRIKATLQQSLIMPNKRQKNVANAFLIKRRSPISLWNRPAEVCGKKIMLVDDILTTGSTCEAITSLLLAAGAQRVDVVVIARGQGTSLQIRKTDPSQPLEPLSDEDFAPF
ncbi:MAG: phosphoribosyltransferase family protein [Planctomycetia bacterium]|nr:phosphoribosyltransferase family protein [Planctomycetia bacterium]